MISSNAALAEICASARQKSALALDTEFVRTRTYYPRLGLIQLFDGEQLSLIDPTTISDWQPFIALLQDQQVTKFLHAGSEDLEVFQHQYGVMPVPMIDSQILAAFCGKTLSLGFASLVENYTGVALDKSEARTDWLARPLTARQCQYAAADVWYLLPIALTLVEETRAAGWLPAAINECQLLCQRRQVVADPQQAWRDITNSWQLQPRQLAALRLLAAWRLEQARQKDLAVNFVLREENLWKVARYLPGTLGELDHLGIPGQEIRYHGKRLLELVSAARQLDESDLPAPLSNLIDMPDYKRLFKEIKAQIAGIAQQTGLSQELLASRRQINQLLSWHWQIKPGGQMPELLHGWRGDLLKEKLMNLLGAAAS
ncbi:ribonuclease D [Erwinia sp. OLTSP20]|uniref:ribonuclease D n=1 Tax=unclassified Erwinia TaxID=2622719 RepID=UPI000C195EB0|nr:MULTISPECIES: ribonuclease D [unclassified Erwinia]PIJ51462.1 ribonuclease D [Erwinia sp. OAMSP11]PIJ73483.1 ribonuclease D [Erwinia sp. OLSSP12]PIJ85546.1 ribonuclease D [Erwinia sp. OLCASP19]PIJ85944.1 ribonuclease D [Erwinia sp. OLMTSP26]PIJ87425.1 ribonuclease D [Erwinia sp. OLMDSP33]